MIEMGLTAAATWSVLPLMRATPLLTQFGSSEGLKKDQALVDNLRFRMKISKEIIVKQTPANGYFEFAAFGALALPFEQSFLVPQLGSEDWESVPEHQRPFIYAHEIAHIEANDILKMSFIALITHIGVTVIVVFLLPIEIAYAIGGVCAFSAVVLYSRHIEKRADLRACEVLTDEEIANGILFFEGMRHEQKLIRLEAMQGNSLRDLWDRTFIDDQGNYSMDVFHPPLTDRISYMKQSIRDQRVIEKLDNVLRDLQRKPL